MGVPISNALINRIEAVGLDASDLLPLYKTHNQWRHGLTRTVELASLLVTFGEAGNQVDFDANIEEFRNMMYLGLRGLAAEQVSVDIAEDYINTCRRFELRHSARFESFDTPLSQQQNLRG